MTSLRLVSCSTLLVLIIGAATFAGGDTRPANAGGNDAMPSDPYNGNGPTDYPAIEVEAVPVARARATQARLEAELVQDELHRAIRWKHEDFEHSKEYLEAAAAENAAQMEYDQARASVLRKLSNDPGYRSLVDMIAQMKEQIENERPSSKAMTYQIEHFIALATVKLGYASTVSAMEAAALAADSRVQNAKNRLIDAAAKTATMRAYSDRTIRRDPEILAMQRNYRDARITRVTSAVFRDSAIEARDIAMTYAVYLHWWDQYRYSVASYYPYYGYGAYGYGSGYGPYYVGSSTVYPYARRY
ncbi:MAG: hypothetical protein ACREJC_02195 [Tepidisphaeraceae bacterium]